MYSTAGTNGLELAKSVCFSLCDYIYNNYMTKITCCYHTHTHTHTHSVEAQMVMMHFRVVECE